MNLLRYLRSIFNQQQTNNVSWTKIHISLVWCNINTFKNSFIFTIAPSVYHLQYIFDLYIIYNPHWARVVDYGPFSLCVIHKETCA
jgi:hypothetical protein